MRDQAAGTKCWKMMASCGVLSMWPVAGTMPAPGLAGNDRAGASSAARIPECPMQLRLPDLGWAPRAALLTALLPLLANCGPARNEFAPACPGRVILGDAADLDIYRQGSSPGAAYDLTDLVLHGRI